MLGKEHEQAIRDLVIKHHKYGKKPPQIIECLVGQISKPTIINLIKLKYVFRGFYLIV